jgi:hypothetical protein
LPDFIDEDGINHNAILRELFKKRRKHFELRCMRLDELAERINSDHDIGNRDGLRKLLSRLDYLSVNRPSDVTIEPGNVVVPSDMGHWKDASKALGKLAKALTDADEGLQSALENPVQLAAIVRENADEQMGKMIVSVSELRRRIALAADIKGKAGRPPNPDWHAIAAEKCLAFWREHKDATACPRFGDDETGNSTIPGNKFTSWFCEVMHEIANVTITECRTALKKKEIPEEFGDYFTKVSKH